MYFLYFLFKKNLLLVYLWKNAQYGQKNAYVWRVVIKRRHDTLCVKKGEDSSYCRIWSYCLPAEIQTYQAAIVSSHLTFEYLWSIKMVCRTVNVHCFVCVCVICVSCWTIAIILFVLFLTEDSSTYTIICITTRKQMWKYVLFELIVGKTLSIIKRKPNSNFG